jgi:hypothetical protein
VLLVARDLADQLPTSTAREAVRCKDNGPSQPESRPETSRECPVTTRAFLTSLNDERFENDRQGTGDMAWRSLFTSVMNWSVWGFMLLIVLSQYLGKHNIDTFMIHVLG